MERIAKYEALIEFTEEYLESAKYDRIDVISPVLKIIIDNGYGCYDYNPKYIKQIKINLIESEVSND
jgi:hypothetical protein